LQNKSYLDVFLLRYTGLSRLGCRLMASEWCRFNK